MSLTTCRDCRDLNLRIFDVYESLPYPMYPNCRCYVDPLGAIYNGTATIGGDVYKNREMKLPEKAGRVWYEADINYTGGFRNTHRLLYSNDGLLFVTYDHYQTFYEII